jgi:hypothetical protein
MKAAYWIAKARDKVKTFYGGLIFMSQKEAADRHIIFGILNKARKAGAEVIVTVRPPALPAHAGRQAEVSVAEARYKIEIPVLYVTAGGHRPWPRAGGAGSEYERGLADGDDGEGV